MKKLLVFMSVLSMTTIGAMAAEQAQNMPAPGAEHKRPPHNQEMRKQKEAEFEKKLGLTEEQKIKAREMRKQGFEKIKPVIDQIREKKKEAEMVKLSRISVQAQEEKLAVIDEEIKVLEKQAMEIRKQNMKEFESILTAEQKKILKKMKKDGRNKYKHSHHPHKK